MILSLCRLPSDLTITTCAFGLCFELTIIWLFPVLSIVHCSKATVAPSFCPNFMPQGLGGEGYASFSFEKHDCAQSTFASSFVGSLTFQHVRPPAATSWAQQNQADCTSDLLVLACVMCSPSLPACVRVMCNATNLRSLLSTAAAKATL